MDMQGKPEKALALVEHAEQFRRVLPEMDRGKYLPTLLVAKVGLLEKLGRGPEALDSLKEAEQIQKAMGDLQGMATTLGFRIGILSRHGRLQEAIIQIGRKVAAQSGEMPSDVGLPPDYWEAREASRGGQLEEDEMGAEIRKSYVAERATATKPWWKFW